MRQIRWSELLGQYKFIIYYIFRKDNGRVDALSKKPDYIIMRKKILRIACGKKNGILTNTIIQLNVIISINNGKTIRWRNNKRVINKKNINDYIRRYHDLPEFGHLSVNGITAIFRRSCYFKNIQARVRVYIKKYKSC